jgi:ketosteroid isomerase-like protein
VEVIMKHHVAWLPVLTLALGLTSCRPTVPAFSETDREVVRGIFGSTMTRVGARDFTAWAGEFAEDGVFMPPNHGAVRGRAALKAWADSLPPMTAFSFSHILVDGSGDLAVGTSAYAITFAPPGAAVSPDTGKQLVVFRRQRDGSWLITAASFNSDLPLSR